MKSTTHPNIRAPEMKREKIGHQTIRTIELDGEPNGTQGHGMTEKKGEEKILIPRLEVELKAKQNQEAKEKKKGKERLVALLQQSLPEAVAWDR